MRDAEVEEPSEEAVLAARGEGLERQRHPGAGTERACTEPAMGLVIKARKGLLPTVIF